MSKKRKSRKQLKRELKFKTGCWKQSVKENHQLRGRIVELERHHQNWLEDYNAENTRLRERRADLEHELLAANITIEKVRDALLDVRSEIASGFNNAAEQLATSGEASLKAIDEIVETETQWVSPPWAETSDNPNLVPESFRTSWDEKE